MFRTSFALSALVAMSQATSKSPMSLAQISMDMEGEEPEAAGNDCCCQEFCYNQCDNCPEQRPFPHYFEPLPPPVQDVLLDLDVIVSHILHEIRPTLDPDTIPPANDPAEEFKFIQTELTPLILQVMVNDIAPALPVCTFPDGSSFYLNDAPDPNPASTIVDPQEVLETVLDSAISSLSENASDATREALAAIDASQVVEDLLIESENGEVAERVIIAGHQTELEGQWTDDQTTLSLDGQTTGLPEETIANIE